LKFLTVSKTKARFFKRAFLFGRAALLRRLIRLTGRSALPLF